MKKNKKKITCYLAVITISFGYLDSFILAKGGESNEQKIGESEISKYYMEDGIPVVRREVFLEDKEKINSSLRKAIKQKSSKETVSKTLPPKIEMNNIVIFLRFKGEEEFVTDQNRELFINHYNGSGVSLRSYMQDISYGQFEVLSGFFPVDPEDTKFYSYEAKNPRGYYQPFSSKNTIGYKSRSSSNNREFELLTEAISYCRPMIEEQYTDPVEVDFNEDGKVDNVVFVVSGREDTWEDLLWPHQFVIPKAYKDAKIHDKRVKLYNLMLQSCFKENNVGTSSHEFLHTKGFPDFYRYKSKGEPVGCWDLMSIQHSVPQFPLVYPRYKYGAFCNKPEKIKQGGKYVLHPSTDQDYKQDISYILKSPTTDAREYFVVEYRAPAKYNPEETSDHWDQFLPGEGLIVYRVNKDVIRGNAMSDGVDIPDKIFIFRKGITEPWAADGDIKEGALLKTGDSLGVIDSCHQFKRYSRLEIPKLEDKIYFSDGDNSGIKIYDINIDDQDKVASFRVEFDNTFITKASLDKAKDIKIDNHNKKILFNLSKKFKDKFIVPEIEHNGVSIEPELGLPLIISNEMEYKIKSPTGVEQVWEIITSPVCRTCLEDQKERASKPIILKADLINSKDVKYQWYYDGKILVDQTFEELVLENPNDNKKHKVHFVATNQAGSFQSENVTVSWENPQDESQPARFSSVTGFFANLFSQRRRSSSFEPKRKSKVLHSTSENNLQQIQNIQSFDSSESSSSEESLQATNIDDNIVFEQQEEIKEIQEIKELKEIKDINQSNELENELEINTTKEMEQQSDFENQIEKVEEIKNLNIDQENQNISSTRQAIVGVSSNFDDIDDIIQASLDSKQQSNQNE